MEIWDRIKAARPGDPVVYVNLDAVASLPDEFEAVPAVVSFNTNNLEESFTNVGTNKAPSWYPKTALMYDIAEKRGISSGAGDKLEPIYEEVELSLMEMADNPVICRKKVGYQATKSGLLTQEDGTTRDVVRSSVENAWDECVGLWNKEEGATEGYTKTVEKFGKRGYETEWNGQKSWHECKYDTKYKRRCHFDELLDKAAGKAETKAKEKVIRELAGLKTGYTTADLSEGKFYFVKIVRSKLAIKTEAAARLTRIGGSTPAVELPAPAPAPAPKAAPIIAPPAPVVDDVSEMKRKLSAYKDNKLVRADQVAVAGRILAWLEVTKAPKNDPVYWPKAMGLVADIESAIPEDMRI